MTEDAGQNYLILMKTIRIYMDIQIANSGVCEGQPPPVPSPRQGNFISYTAPGKSEERQFSKRDALK